MCCVYGCWLWTQGNLRKAMAIVDCLNTSKVITHLANGPWDKSLNYIFPTKYVIPKSLKFSHWPSKINMIILGRDHISQHKPTEQPCNIESAIHTRHHGSPKIENNPALIQDRTLSPTPQIEIFQMLKTFSFLRMYLWEKGTVSSGWLFICLPLPIVIESWSFHQVHGKLLYDSFAFLIDQGMHFLKFLLAHDDVVPVIPVSFTTSLK